MFVSSTASASRRRLACGAVASAVLVPLALGSLVVPSYAAFGAGSSGAASFVATASSEDTFDLSAVGFSGLTVSEQDLRDAFKEMDDGLWGIEYTEDQFVSAAITWIEDASSYQFLQHGVLHGFKADAEIPDGWTAYSEVVEGKLASQQGDTIDIVKTSLSAANILDYADRFADGCAPTETDALRVVFLESLSVLVQDNVLTKNQPAQSCYDGAVFDGDMSCFPDIHPTWDPDRNWATYRFFADTDNLTSDQYEGRDVASPTGYAAPFLEFIRNCDDVVCTVPDYEGEVPEGKVFSHWTVLRNHYNDLGYSQISPQGPVPDDVDLSALPEDAFWYFDRRFYYLDPVSERAMAEAAGEESDYLDIYPGDLVDTGALNQDTVGRARVGVARVSSPVVPVFVDAPEEEEPPAGEQPPADDDEKTPPVEEEDDQTPPSDDGETVPPADTDEPTEEPASPTDTTPIAKTGDNAALPATLGVLSASAVLAGIGAFLRRRASRR